MTINEMRNKVMACKKARPALALWTHIVNTPQGYLSVKELVMLYGVHRSTIYRWRRLLVQEGFLVSERGLLKVVGLTEKITHSFGENNPGRRLAGQLLTLRREHDEGFARDDDAQVVAMWAQQLRGVNSQKKRSWHEIERVIEFSQKDKFWSTHIISVKKLGQHFDALMVAAQRCAGQEASRVYVV